MDNIEITLDEDLDAVVVPVLPDGVYKAIISGAELKKTKDGLKDLMVVDLTIPVSSLAIDSEITNAQNLKYFATLDQKNAISMKSFGMALKALGISRAANSKLNNEVLNSVREKEVYVTIKKQTLDNGQVVASVKNLLAEPPKATAEPF